METTNVRPLPPPRSTETSVPELEAMARAMHLTIDMPPAEGGWARVTTERGARYHAYVPAAKGARA